MSDDFIHQFAIRMPNGQLYRNVVTPQPVEDFSIPIAKQAEAFGVNLYGGTVVERLCTPFTSNDPAVQFGREVAEWALKQGDNL